MIAPLPVLNSFENTSRLLGLIKIRSNIPLVSKFWRTVPLIFVAFPLATIRSLIESLVQETNWVSTSLVTFWARTSRKLSRCFKKFHVAWHSSQLPEQKEGFLQLRAGKIHYGMGIGQGDQDARFLKVCQKWISPIKSVIDCQCNR